MPSITWRAWWCLTGSWGVERPWGKRTSFGCVALGRDINPVACESVRVALGRLDRDALMRAFGALASGVGERVRGLYQTTDAQGQACDVLYYFWVKTVPCPHCAAVVDLFPSYIFARNASPNRKPEVKVYCPRCANVFPAKVNDTTTTCPQCEHCFNPQCGPADGASAQCPSCKGSFPIAKAVRDQGRPPAHRLYAKLVLTATGDKLYLPATEQDRAAYRRCAEELVGQKLPLPTLALAHGHNTKQALNYCYRSWRDFFNDRQLLALGLLHQALLALPEDAVRGALLSVFSGTLEFNNVFASYKGEGTGAVRHMFAHHILKPERMPIESNVWGTSKSSGSFSTPFKSRLMRAIEYQAAPFEVALARSNGHTTGRKVFGASAPFSGRVATTWPPPAKPNARAIYLSCGSSDSTGLPAGSVDLVVTDPPFFDNVHYSELADFFYAWQQQWSTPFILQQTSTRQPKEVQDVSAVGFASKLEAVFTECRRVLKDDGLLVFTYHHSRSEGWTALAEAVLGAGFTCVNAHPVKAEMSVAMPKSQAKEPIQLDIVLVCRKAERDKRARVAPEAAFANALARARQKANRLKGKDLNLSCNDARVILISQFLVEASAQRAAGELGKVLEEKLPELETAAVVLCPSDSLILKPEGSSPHPEQEQLVLLDRPSAKPRRPVSG